MNPMVGLILGIIIWVGILMLQIVVMSIARFFERTSGQRTYHQLYFIPILLTGVSAFRYLWRVFWVDDRWPDFVGDPVANILMFVAGLLLIGLSNALHEKMMGGKANEHR